MSGAYSIFPLQLVVVFNLTTTSNRNDFEAYFMISLRLRQVFNLTTTQAVEKVCRGADFFIYMR